MRVEVHPNGFNLICSAWADKCEILCFLNFVSVFKLFLGHVLRRSLLDEEQQRIVDDLAPAALQLPDGSAAAIDYSHDPPSVAKAPTAEEVPEKRERHCICEGLVKLHMQQELKTAEAVSGRRAASKAPKGKKKRGRK